MASHLAAFARFYDNQDRSDVTIVITTEAPETCRARKSGQQQPSRKRQCRRQQDGPSDEEHSAAGASSQEAAVCEEGSTAVELHGHAVVLSAHSQFFDIASSRNSGFNTRPGVEQQDDAARKFVVVSVDNEKDMEAAALMVKTMYGIDLPEGISTTQLLSTLRLAHQYRVEPALRSALVQVRRLLTQRDGASASSGAPSSTGLLTVYSSSSHPTAYECVLAEARSGCGTEAPAGAVGAQSLTALATEVLQFLRYPFTCTPVVEVMATEPHSRASDFCALVRMYCQLPAGEVAHLLSSRQLAVVCEDTVFALALRWLQANQAASTDDRRAVWNAIRLPGLSPWLKAVVMGGLPEATELMDSVSHQHAAACFISGEAVPPAHLGTSGCTYGSDTLAWSPRAYPRRLLWPPKPHSWRPGRIEELVLSGKGHFRKCASSQSAWTLGGVEYVLQLQMSDVPGGQVDVVAAMDIHVNWCKERPRSAQAWAPAPLTVPGLFAVKAGSWLQPRVMTPAGSDVSPRRLLAECSLGTFPKSAVGVAQLQQVLVGQEGALQLIVYKCDDDGAPLQNGLTCNGSAGPFRGPCVRMPRSAA